MHSPHTEEWTLRIRYAQRKDTGIYECQISTTPPIGHPVRLNVVGKDFVFIKMRVLSSANILMLVFFLVDKENGVLLPLYFKINRNLH